MTGIQERKRRASTLVARLLVNSRDRGHMNEYALSREFAAVWIPIIHPYYGLVVCFEIQVYTQLS
jgi:hypothetical protein